jgi:anti-anti-sigma regulatory factor
LQLRSMTMLKITLLDSAEEFRFRLDGKLTGPWVAELRQCWLTASSTTAGRRTVVDLDEVEYVDRAGEDLLGDMTREGVRLEASTPFMRGVVEQVAVAARCGRVEGKSARSANVLVCSDPPGPHSRAV